MDALSNFLGRELMKRIETKREEMLKPLVMGQAADYPDYRARAAYLKALADVHKMIEDIDLDGDRRPDGFARQHEAGPRRTA
jgi:hypothetical protein